MNRTAAATTLSKSDVTSLEEKQTTTRKRKSTTSSDNSSAINNNNNKSDSNETETSDSLSNSRKSTRIKNSNTNTPSKNVVLVVPKINKSNNSSSDTSQLNGAQFLNAASINTTTNATKLAKQSETHLTLPVVAETQIDLNKLSEKVDDLSKKLEEHTSLFKRLTNVVDRLSAKLDDSINNSIQSRNSDLKRKSPGKRSNSTDASHPQEEEVDEHENEEVDDGDDDDDAEEEETIKKTKKRKSQDENDITIMNNNNLNDDIELINQNKAIPSEREKSFNLSLNTIAAASSSSPLISNSPSKLIKLKLDNLPPGLNEEIETVVSASLIEMKNAYVTSNQMSESNNQAKNIKYSITTIGNNNNNNNDSTHYASDSSHSDADDEDEEEDVDGSKKSSNNSNKNGNIAILNKTKIDTEFISNLIANKDPNDKRYDANEINKLRLLSHSYQNFAVKLLCRLFDEEEIIGRNVYGRNYSGDKTIMKQPLDPERINFIKETVLRLTKTNNPELAWASCVIAMNRKMVDINNKYLKGLKNE